MAVEAVFFQDWEDSFLEQLQLREGIGGTGRRVF
jgi:hypothetical protein